MAHTLELLIVLASIATTVLRVGSDLYKCSDETYNIPVEKELQCPYKIRQREISINMAHYDVQRDFQSSVYAYAPSVTVQDTLRVEQERCDLHSTVETNDDMHDTTFSWDYECDVAAVANIVSGSGFYKMLPGACQVYIFTKKDQWNREGKIHDNLKKHIQVSVEYQIIDDNNVPEEVRSVVADETASLEAEICARVNDDSRTFHSHLRKKIFPLPLIVTINDAVDNSLSRFRVNVENRRRCATNTELKNIRFSTYVTDVDIDGHVTFTGGIFENFSKIERVGNATATIQANVYNIKSTFRFPQARILFDSYHFRSEKIPVSGTIYLIMQDLEIQLERSGFLNHGVCNESVWLNITKLSNCSYEFSHFQSDQSRLSNALKCITPTQLMNVKEMLGLYLVWNVLQYGVADYTNYIYGPCMSNSSKEWRHIYSSRTDFRFT